jgi:hypothetical protein
MFSATNEAANAQSTVASTKGDSIFSTADYYAGDAQLH